MSDDEREYEEMLGLLCDPLDRYPELRDQGDALALERYDAAVHQLAHQVLLLGAVDVTACDIARPIMIMLFTLGYVLGRAHVLPGNVDGLNRLLGDIEVDLEP